MDFWNNLPGFIRRPAAKAYVHLAMYAKHILWYSTHCKKPDYYNIPIVINNFNRLTYLQLLIQSLEKRGYFNIYIIDNHSTYPPLLDYYNNCPYTVFRLGKNLGFRSLWRCELYELFKRSFYVYTDSDIVLDDLCPNDFMQVFANALKKHPTCMKVGFGLRIDDLPAHYKNRDKVLEHESQFWSKPIDDLFYEAEIDTTFALYRPYCYGHADGRHKMLRSGKPYLAKHAPWYVDSDNLSEEEKYYALSCSQETHWTEQEKNNIKQAIKQ